MAKNNTAGFTIGDGFRFGIGFLIAQFIFAILAGVAWFAIIATGVVGATLMQR